MKLESISKSKSQNLKCKTAKELIINKLKL